LARNGRSRNGWGRKSRNQAPLQIAPTVVTEAQIENFGEISCFVPGLTVDDQERARHAAPA
jgi:hypothetical protein